jgi:hypothetical protein
MPIDFATDIGMVRLLLNDVDEANLVFETAEIQAFLDLEGGSVKLAAAQAIDTNATNEALASKVIKDHQVSTDGAKLADAMRKHAQSLRDQVAESDDFYFEIIPARSYYDDEC